MLRCNAALEPLRRRQNLCSAPMKNVHRLNCAEPKWKYEKLAVVVRVPAQATQSMVIFHVVVLQRTAKKCTKITWKRTCTALFYSVSLLFCGGLFRPRPHVPGYSWIRTFSFRIRLASTLIRRIRQQIRSFLNPLSRVEKNKSSTNPITCGLVNPDIFATCGRGNFWIFKEKVADDSEIFGCPWTGR